jgi:uncharacterized glyoxalase superfamily protein PhnB
MTQNPELLGKIFHAELKIGDMNLYLADSGEEPSLTSMNFVVEISEEDEARKILEKIVQNGKKISDFEVMPVELRIARAEDKFGIK